MLAVGLACVRALAKRAARGGVRALAREIFPATQLKNDFVLKNTANGQRAVRVTGFVREIAAVWLSWLSVRGALHWGGALLGSWLLVFGGTTCNLQL